MKLSSFLHHPHHEASNISQMARCVCAASAFALSIKDSAGRGASAASATASPTAITTAQVFMAESYRFQSCGKIAPSMKTVLFLLAALAAHAADYNLKATPQTVVWGYYWSAAKPVLTIQSGDTVTIQAMATYNPTTLRNGGVKEEDIEPELKTIYVEGAEPGDTLEVRIHKIRLNTAYASNGFSPNRGVLPKEDFERGRSKI